jgi:hypothetical protein
MRILSLVFTLLVVGNTAVTAWGADLTKIDRKIAKEPVYQNKPKYCLIVFGPEAKFRAWLVRDGKVLYVDTKGNGDLTEPGQRKQLDETPGYMDAYGTIVLAIPSEAEPRPSRLGLHK